MGGPLPYGNFALFADAWMALLGIYWYKCMVPQQHIVQQSNNIFTIYYSFPFLIWPFLQLSYTLEPFPPHSTQPQKPSHPHPPPLPRIQLRPNIQVEIPHPTPPPIKINNILHLLPLPFPLLNPLHISPPTPLHNPIMPIKRPLIPQPPKPPRPRRQPSGLPPKTPQPRPPTPFIPLPRPPTPRFPRFDLSPSALVDGVVDGHDEGHVFRARGVGFARQGVEEHAFGGVDPVPRGRGERGGGLGVWGGEGGGWAWGCGWGRGVGAGDGGGDAVES